jgi:hypothetical protein
MIMRQFQISSTAQMSLPAKIASIAFGLVLLLPIFALLIVAGVVSAFVFGILLLVGVVRAKARALFGAGSGEIFSAGPSAGGRKNVRIKRD